MKNIRELQAILTGIYLLNRTAEKPNPEVEKICEYAFRRCLEANTNLLLLATIGQTYDTMKEQVADLFRRETKFSKTMGEEL